ncbi:hypothetical protein [Sanguibacter suaedae]|uniref:Transcriptional regulator, AbiEi antitoxin, Type IV TA system n=1 Tax=Sanguibacter suaedae TaxID=2795737 RepID=A0A934I1F4_9MICO|nr:hypothetical protein [Sanguibacter suaedae]MBI9113433.1 hypothetical protein [Sanguibacter suaedae]
MVVVDDSRMPRRPVAPPTVHLARDVTAAHARSLVRDGAWLRVRPGAYIDAPRGDAPPGDTRRAVALARTTALARQSARSPTFSHTSAALLWGLPLVPGDRRIHVVQESRPGSSGDAGVVRHRIVLPGTHRTHHRGLAVTTLERTVVDCLRSLPPLPGLVIADAALHVGADRDTCARMLDAMAGTRGIVKARELLALADGGSESPGETRVRFEALRIGLPVPETQVCVQTGRSTWWADLGWVPWRLLVEYDGRDKYDGATTEALLRERRRQDALEDSGWHVVRVMKEDLRDPALLRHRLLRHVPADARAALVARRTLNSR